MARRETRAYACDVCNKPTSRLFGFTAVIRLADGPSTRIKTSVRGYCATHREEIPGRFASDIEAEGTVQWSAADEPAELRPYEVEQWIKTVDGVISAVAAENGDTEVGGSPLRTEW